MARWEPLRLLKSYDPLLRPSHRNFPLWPDPSRFDGSGSLCSRRTDSVPKLGRQDLSSLDAGPFCSRRGSIRSAYQLIYPFSFLRGGQWEKEGRGSDLAISRVLWKYPARRPQRTGRSLKHLLDNAMICSAAARQAEASIKTHGVAREASLGEPCAAGEVTRWIDQSVQGPTQPSCCRGDLHRPSHLPSGSSD
jgi:hypothetical protein